MFERTRSPRIGRGGFHPKPEERQVERNEDEEEAPRRGEGDSDGSFDHVMMSDLGTADLASLVASNKYKGWLLDQVRLCTL